MSNIFNRNNENGRPLRNHMIPVAALAAALGCASANLLASGRSEVSFDIVRTEAVITHAEFALGVEYGMLESGKIIPEETSNLLQALDSRIRPLVTDDMKDLADKSWAHGVVSSVYLDWSAEDLHGLVIKATEVDKSIEIAALETLKRMKNDDVTVSSAIMSINAVVSMTLGGDPFDPVGDEEIQNLDDHSSLFSSALRDATFITLPSEKAPVNEIDNSGERTAFGF